MGKLLNPFIDFAFKYIFGREETKEFLIDFLNSLFLHEPDFSPIVNLSYKNKETSKRNEEERGIIYDIYCETENHRHFTVEMQHASQNFFFERMLYYTAK